MLRDRRLLLEQEIAKARTAAANMYLSIVVGGDVHSEEYQQLRDRVSDLQFDLQVVNDLIRQGQE